MNINDLEISFLQTMDNLKTKSVSPEEFDFNKEKAGAIQYYIGKAIPSLKHAYNVKYNEDKFNLYIEASHCKINYERIEEIKEYLKNNINGGYETVLLRKILSKVRENEDSKTSQKIHEQTQTYWRAIENLDFELMTDVLGCYLKNDDIVWENLIVLIDEKFHLTKGQTR